MILLGEIEDCRKYITYKFPDFVAGARRYIQTSARLIESPQSNETRKQVRDACVAAGYEPKLVQVAMRRPRFYYYELRGTGTYQHWIFTERYRSESTTGWSERVDAFPTKDGKYASSVPTDEERDAEIYRLKSEGCFVGTREEVIKLTGPVGGECESCGEGNCGCEDGLIVGEMYEISSNKKPPLVARYIRWNNRGANKHEFRTLDGTKWTSVRSEDVKTGVKGKFRDVPTKPAVAPRNAFAAAQKQQVINRKARKASPNVDYQFRLYAIQDTGTDCMHALAIAAQSALGEMVDVKVTETTIAALKDAIGDLTAWLGLFQEKAKDEVDTENRPHYKTRSEVRDGKRWATCNVCGEMVQVVQHFRYKHHDDPATKKRCWRSMKSVGGHLDDGSYIA